MNIYNHSWVGINYQLFAIFFAGIMAIGSISPLSVQAQSKSSKDFTIAASDSLMLLVEGETNESNRVVRYRSQIETPVCADSLCHIMKVTVYWDLLGHFLKYETLPDSPLTKFDHEEFTTADHAKMYSILAAKDSPLRDYQKQDLMDHSQVQTSQVVDGVAGATNVSIQPYIVEGALYSTYVLWHLVNGPVAKHIEAMTLNNMQAELIDQFLHSESHHEQYYALSHIKELNPKITKAIVRLIKEGKEYVPLFAVEQLPAEAWASEENQVYLFSDLKQYPFTLQNAIIKKLSTIHLLPNGLVALLPNLVALKDNQVLQILTAVTDQRISIPGTIQKELKEFVATHGNTRIRDFLPKLLF